MIIYLLKFKELLCTLAKWGQNGGLILKNMWSLSCKKRERHLGEIHCFPTQKHEETVTSNAATGKNNLGLNISGTWCRKVLAEVGACTSFLPLQTHHRAHTLHSHCCRWDPSGVSRLGIGIWLHWKHKEITKSLFATSTAPIQESFAESSTVAQVSFPFSIEENPQICFQICAVFLSNVQGHVFWQIPCHFCSSEVL